MSQQLTKQQILPALLETKGNVRLLSADNRHIGTITADQARIKVLTMGGLLEVHGTLKRVRFMREKAVAHVAQWEACYRNTSAPVLQPSIEWLRGVA